MCYLYFQTRVEKGVRVDLKVLKTRERFKTTQDHDYKYQNYLVAIMCIWPCGMKLLRMDQSSGICYAMCQNNIWNLPSY